MDPKNLIYNEIYPLKNQEIVNDKHINFSAFYNTPRTHEKNRENSIFLFQYGGCEILAKTFTLASKL